MFIIIKTGKNRTDNNHFDICSKYFYSKLTEQEKNLYEKISSGWFDHKSKIMVAGQYSSHSFERVFEAIHEDIPELFYVNFSRISISGTPMAMCVSAEYLYSKAESESLIIQIKDVLKIILASSTNNVDKIKVAHDYLTKNVKYAFSAKTDDVYSIVGALLNKEAVCEGYARSFKLLCDTLGVPCIVVSGTATNLNGAPERHAWNIVRFNGANYHVDTTWDAPSYRSGATMPYYLVSDQYIHRDHKWDENKWPKCYTKGSFESNTITVTGPGKLIEVLKQAIMLKKTEVTISFNKTFSSEKEINKLISDSISKISPMNVAQYSCRFVGKYDNVIVGFVYR